MATQHTVVENIDALMRGGLAVRDVSGKKIGSVKDYSNAAGYLVVLAGLVAHKELYVPYSAITSMDPGEIYLNLECDALTRQYSAPPQAKTIVDGHIAVTVVPGGYDGSPAPLNRVDLGMVRRDLARGMAIYATYGDKVGTVDGIDEVAGYLVAKRRNLFRTHDFFIPFTVIKTIDRWFETAFGDAGPYVVYLAVSRDVLVKEYTRLPDGVVLHIDAA